MINTPKSIKLIDILQTQPNFLVRGMWIHLPSFSVGKTDEWEPESYIEVNTDTGLTFKKSKISTHFVAKILGFGVEYYNQNGY